MGRNRLRPSDMHAAAGSPRDPNHKHSIAPGGVTSTPGTAHRCLYCIVTMTGTESSESGYRWNLRRLVSISLRLCTHSNSPVFVSNVPLCSLVSFKVNRGPSSCTPLHWMKYSWEVEWMARSDVRTDKQQETPTGTLADCPSGHPSTLLSQQMSWGMRGCAPVNVGAHMSLSLLLSLSSSHP